MASYGESEPLVQPQGTNYGSNVRTRWSSVDLASADHPPPSPFDTGFPMVFPSPIPSPRPHRLPFVHSRESDKYRSFHVFLTLLMSMINGGLLVVPYTFTILSTMEAIITLVCACICSILSANALLISHVRVASVQETSHYIGISKRFASIQSMAVIASGEWLGYLVSIVTAIGIYGGCVAFIRIAKDITPCVIAVVKALVHGQWPVTVALNHPNTQTDDSFINAATIVTWFSFLIIVLPLCLLKNLSGLRLSSYVGFTLSLYLVGAITYFSVSPIAPLSSTKPIDPQDMPVDLRDTGSFFNRVCVVLAIYSYAYMAHLNLLPLFIQLRGSFAEPLPTSQWKMQRILIGVTLCCTCLYVAVGYCSVQVYGTEAIYGNILLNMENDAMMQLPVCAVFITTLVSFPLLFHPLRSIIEELVYSLTRMLSDDASNLEWTFSMRLTFTAILLLSQMLVATWVSGIEAVLALTGATCCCLICFVLPAILFTKVHPWRDHGQLTQKEGTMMVILWTLVVVFCIASARTLWSLLVSGEN